MMKTGIYRKLIFFSTGLALGISAVGAEEPREVARPRDTGEALINPDMGWTLHFYSNIIANYGSKLEPSDTVDDFPGLSVVYLRVPWAFLEPKEGEFNWALLDTPAQRWIAKGKKIALRVTCSESWMRYATPQWVKDAGAKGVDFNFGKGPAPDGKLWDPDYLDPIFLQKLDNFLAAMARRYDGNPNVAFVDVGSFGMWGEGHTGASSRLSEAQTLEAVKRHIDLHLKHFKRTLLNADDDMAGSDKPGRHFPATDYALSKSLTLRDDSILVQPPPRSWYHAEMAQDFWPRFPVILEHEHYGSSKQRGAWGDGSLLLKAVEDYHASYMSIHWWPREELNENRALIERINQRMGYRLQLREISWPKQIVPSQPFMVETQWANAGVAPCYPGGFWALTLKDAKGGIVSLNVDESFDMRNLKVAAPGQAPVEKIQSRFVVAMRHKDGASVFAPPQPQGAFDVFVSIGQRDGTPTIALPLGDGDGQRRYKLGTINILAK
ncbi:MAG: DUF4832 domain-containing protein [Candidatus Sumerlaeota bacterium]|nr:DUF4832 domain-containing protein [Candidatus Sumerlaeota bacterium]